MGFARADVTEDKFLGGQLTLMQPRAGYRAGVDPVFLAAAISAQAGESVRDLGCGAGAAALCLGTRVPGLKLVGVERQADYADLARINAFDNDIDMEVITADLTRMPPEVTEESFDQVIMNPPYNHDRQRPSPDELRSLAHAMGEGGLDPWLAATLGALVASWVTFLPSFLWIFLGAPHVERLYRNAALGAALSAITAAVVGVILNLAVWFALHVVFAEVAPWSGFGLSLDLPVPSSLDLAALVLTAGAVFAVFRLGTGMAVTLAATASLGLVWTLVAPG